MISGTRQRHFILHTTVNQIYHKMVPGVRFAAEEHIHQVDK